MFRFLTIVINVEFVLNSMSFEIDASRLESRVQEYVQSWYERITKEVKFLGSLQPDLIVSDIAPWVFHAANKLQIKSVLMTNFTWVEIYKEYLSLLPVKAYQDSYALANEVLIYDLSGVQMKEQFIKYDEVSLCARPFDLLAVAEIQSRYNQPLVFVSVERLVDLMEEIAVIERNRIAEERATVEWLVSRHLA